ncbi:hypothetical protein EGR_00001 [Echinococcus granulosus]|uniref:Uncharacterized protein n=1 Tax=Echinococcus granulosus TaxID=6210 RepID=W6V1D4_ECHGR|nr:hypothetical protein EGR_00001 [Echinococcus granulosus]EUB64732.1 hypothetical protein EGR_00001 [Echinococcus granulosus]
MKRLYQIKGMGDLEVTSGGTIIKLADSLQSLQRVCCVVCGLLPPPLYNQCKVQGWNILCITTLHGCIGCYLQKTGILPIPHFRSACYQEVEQQRICSTLLEGT